MLEDLKRELDRLVAEGRYREFEPYTHRNRGKITVRGQVLTDFTSWDLLNLNNEPALKRALQVEAEAVGIGASASRLSSGTTPAHLSVEHRIAKFLGTESALLFSSTNQAIISIASALLTERDCVIVDETEHSPVVDAAHLVNCEVIHFSPQNLEALPSILERAKSFKNRLLFVESVSPYSGATANLSVIANHVERAEALLIVDESCGIGTMGIRGAGGTEHYNVAKRAFALFGSLGRGLGIFGAFVAGSKLLTDYLINRSRTFTSENALPAPLCAAIEKAIDLTELAHAGRERLRSLALRFRAGLIPMGLCKDIGSDSAIISINVSRARFARELALALFQRGILCEALSDGLILEQGSTVRFILNSAHTDEDIDRTLGAIAEVYKRI